MLYIAIFKVFKYDIDHIRALNLWLIQLHFDWDRLDFLFCLGISEWEFDAKAI
jgi:hypothetical protein